ncbi:MAG: DNA polymerase III subunit gamma/tau [Candidatus Pacebacteria bacterium]|nr:DNA polymerase III subunit gamma/tau [Candidatus Paceibacterota bacterium]
MSWPLKYRPRNFEDLALKDIREQLIKLVKSGTLPQVFLFAGPKGSGKTSTSRIISSILNKELDDVEHDKIFSGKSFIVNELDAASNRGIDDIRLLKERVSLPPQLGNKAVYILDEAHMLTREAFNALLKLLEEPPEHAIFILATTELHKIPDTIVSRANLVKFRQAHNEEMREVLSRILKNEKIEFEDKAVDQVIKRSGGSFRDAVKLLEMVCRGEKKLSLSSLDVLGSISLQEELFLLVDSVLAKDEQKVVQVIKTFRENGEEEKFVYKSLLDMLHQDLMKALGINDGEAKYSKIISLFLLDNLINLPVNEISVIPFLHLEVKLLDLVLKAKGRSGGSTSSPSSAPQTIKKNPPIEKKAIKEQSSVMDSIINEQFISEESIADVVSTASPLPSPLQDFTSDNLMDPSQTDFTGLVDVWEKFLVVVEEKNLTLAALLKSSKLMPDSNQITKVGVYYKFHKLQLEQQKQISLLQTCAQEITGGMPKFEFVLLDTKPVKKPDENAFKVPPSALEKDVSEALM